MWHHHSGRKSEKESRLYTYLHNTHTYIIHTYIKYKSANRFLGRAFQDFMKCDAFAVGLRSCPTEKYPAAGLLGETV